MFSNYKDCQAWKDNGIPLYTASNEACKMYDATLRQITVRKEDSNIGGMQGAIEKMFEADPNFVLAHIVKEYMSVTERPRNDAGVLKSIQNVNTLAESQWEKLSNMEKGHCRALQYLSLGHKKKACHEWEKILVEYPKDSLSLKMSYGVLLMLSEFEELRDVVARVLPFYSRTDIEYGYNLGMYAFGLEETCFYERAENKAREALEINPEDAWCSHTMAHVFEMTGRYNEGLNFLSNNKTDWENDPLACHINWHTTLYNIEKGNYVAALQIYDEEVASRIEKPTSDMFNLSDGITMLYRLKMEGIDVGKERWKMYKEKLEKHMDVHSAAYYDACIMMGFCGTQLCDQQNAFLQDVKDIVMNDDESDIHRVSKSVNLHLCEAIQYYDAREYDNAVDSLLPHRYKISTIGGSCAQKDVFHLLLINAAIQSQNYQKLAIQLLHERKAQKSTPLTDRLLSKIELSHD